MPTCEQTLGLQSNQRAGRASRETNVKGKISEFRILRRIVDDRARLPSSLTKSVVEACDGEHRDQMPAAEPLILRGFRK